ncbi:MAG TPA: plastocyanin/azurin family copper-binding protein [Solirubrobacterales bacterium]|nr:plastocyanin/azurin family copper-binding protein [Solirubrobacterales bacterium]
MKRKVSIVGVLATVAALVALIVPAGGGAAAGTTVKLGDNFFSPEKKRVSSGTTVRFKWVGNNDHNVVKQSGPGKSFASETTDEPGVNFTKKFKKDGKYKIVCTLHQGMDMTLKVN